MTYLEAALGLGAPGGRQRELWFRRLPLERGDETLALEDQTYRHADPYRSLEWCCLGSDLWESWASFKLLPNFVYQLFTSFFGGGLVGDVLKMFVGRN